MNPELAEGEKRVKVLSLPKDDKTFPAKQEQKRSKMG
jgi:hypothetical protein